MAMASPPYLSSPVIATRKADSEVKADRPLHICLIYDRLYPHSIGGAERWYRLLAEQLIAAGHRVTYLTTCHWPSTESPAIPGVHIVTLGTQHMNDNAHRRRLFPLLSFAARVWGHLLRHGRGYDVVQSSAMSPALALAAASLTRRRDYRLVLDWWEVWTRTYWKAYAGAFAGTVGWLLQRVAVKLPHQPIAYSQLHAHRLHRIRSADAVPIIRGLLPDTNCANSVADDPRVVYLGRHIPEKQVSAIIPAFDLARAAIPALRATIFGDGPNTPEIRRAISAAGLDDVVDLPGFVSQETAMNTLGHALCLVLLSRREGYGLVVAEAAARGVPSIVLRHPDSAASELIVEGVNGFTCGSTNPSEVANAILRVHEAGGRLRQSTRDWFCRNRGTLTIDGALSRLLTIYRGETDKEQFAS
jgi:glycosyltransferase involved in cell wall biosynthesis